MRFAALLISMLLLAAGLKALHNDYARKPTDPADVQISEIDEKKANELFAEFLKHKEIAFRYPLDGCYARSSAMALIAEKKGIMMGSIVAEGKLQAFTDNPLYPTARWGWHIAPIAYVKRADGHTELMVFDPTLLKKPIPIDVWDMLLRTSTPDYPASSSLYFGSRFQTAPPSEQASFGKWDKELVEYHRRIMKQYLGFEDHYMPNERRERVPFKPGAPVMPRFTAPSGPAMTMPETGTR